MQAAENNLEISKQVELQEVMGNEKELRNVLEDRVLNEAFAAAKATTRQQKRAVVRMLNKPYWMENADLVRKAIWIDKNKYRPLEEDRKHYPPIEE